MSRVDSMQYAQSVWNDVLVYLQQMHSPLVRQWFHELVPQDMTGGLLTVRCATAIQQQYVAVKCRDMFTEAVQAVTGKLVSVSFTCGSAAVAAGSRLADIYSNEVILSPDYSFENFVTGPTNRMAHAACQAVSERPGKTYNPLFIHGAPGLGKTHLLQATCQEILRRQDDTRIIYLSCDSFINHFMECVQSGDMHQFRNIYRNRVDVLVIDDIHFLAGHDRTQEEFFHTFNTLYQQSRQIILSSDSPPNEIPELEDRLISRFNSGLVTRVERPCYETRCAIVTKKARLRGIDLPENVVRHIASRVESNIRELEGAITKIQGYAMLNGGRYDLETARQALEDMVPPSERMVSIGQIIDQVTAFYNVRLSDLQSKKRHKSITLPRQVCMYLARQRTRYSLEEVGGYFGGRDHTTVMHAVEKIEQARRADTAFADMLNRIEMSLLAAAAKSA